MNRITWVAVAYWAAAMCLLSSEAGGAEPAFRDVLRRFLAHRNHSLSVKMPAGGDPVADQVIALEYAVQLRRSGVEESVDPERHRFQPGDQIRVRIQPCCDAYLYVFFEDDDGRRQCLLPKDKKSPRLAKPDRPIELPTDGSVFEVGTGFKGATLSLIASKEPDEALRDGNGLKALQTRQSAAVAYRGSLSPDALSRLWTEMESRSAVDAVLMEPPSPRQASTFAMLTSKSSRCPQLFLTIRRKPAKSAVAHVPWHTRR